MKLDPAVFNSAEDMMSIAQADFADEQKRRAGRKVVGPHGGAKARFEEWFAKENFAGLSTHEIASLGFDAGHAFCHISASVLPAQDKELTYPSEFTDDLQWILGLICFQCIQYAQALRKGGHDIPTKAEAEQAATLDWMLRHYLRDPENWRKTAAAEMRTMAPSLAAQEGEQS